MEREFKERGTVLDERGRPIPGYSKRSIRIYDRGAIKAPPWRIKEWDFYQISNKNLCLQFTIGHAAYAGQVSLMLFDFVKGEKIADLNKILVLPFGSLHMLSDAEQDGTVKYDKHGIFMSFETKGAQRILRCRWDGIEAQIKLERRNPNSLVINLPFNEYAHAFYYNHKINCMAASGFIRTQKREVWFDKKDSYGILDWGRGVWPFHNEWYWSNATGCLDGEMFGFNLGSGFGNTDTASENMLFYRGKAHKLGKVTFDLGKTYMDTWHIRDQESRLNLKFTPCYDRTTKIKLLWVDNCCHQMFGNFEGYAVLDDGTRLEVKDVISFAEHAVNNW